MMEIGGLFPSFEVDVKGIIELVREKGYQRVLLQVPEGLKRGAPSLSEHIERETGAEVFIDGEPCFGACDHAGTRAQLLRMEAVIHLGHAEIPTMDTEFPVPVHFFPTPMRIDPGPVLKGLEEVLRRSTAVRFGLVTTVQHVGLLEIVKKELERRGRTGLVGAPGGREHLPGQVLGCSFHSPRSISKDVEEYIYIGTGMFHPLGMVNAVRMKVLQLDPMTGDVTGYGQPELDAFLRKRWAAISATMESIQNGGSITIVISTKPGQMREALGRKVREECRQRGLDCPVVVMDHVDPMKLRSLGVGVAVITACPRIAYDDSSRYHAENVILVTGCELSIALGNTAWEDYSFDEGW